MHRSAISRRSFLGYAGAALAGAVLCALNGCNTSSSSSSSFANANAESALPSVVGYDWIDPATYVSTHAASDYELQSSVLFVFDTVVVLKAYCEKDLMKKMTERFNFFEDTFSRTKQGSDVWNINNAGGKPVTVEPETADCINKALAYANHDCMAQGRIDSSSQQIVCLPHKLWIEVKATDQGEYVTQSS